MRKNYIPGLAQFYFKVDEDWSKTDAEKMYKKNSFNDQILYSDCIKGMQSLPEESVDLIIADPPFGLDFTGKEAVYNRKKENVVDGYNEVIENYDSFSEKWIAELPRILKSSGSAMIFSGWTNLKDVLIAIDKSGLTLKNHIIWKYQFGVFTKKKFVSCHYHLLYLVKNEKKTYFHRIEHYNEDVWEIKRTYDPEEVKNGTKLPEQIVKKIIDFLTRPGDVVFDPFMGNGTTAVVAKKNFRHYFGFEMNINMKDIIQVHIDNAILGENYKSYDREPDIKELKEKYPKAYKIYVDEQKKVEEAKLGGIKKVKRKNNGSKKKKIGDEKIDGRIKA